jgi:hypothetical protein
MVQQHLGALVAMRSRRLFVPADQARDLTGLSPDELLSAVRDGVSLQLIASGGGNVTVPDEDLPRVMMNADQSRAWLMQSGAAAPPIARNAGPDPEWGQPFVVHLGKLRAHVAELTALYDPPVADKRSRGGRGPHGAWLVALAEAARFIHHAGPPEPVSQLVRHMKQELARRGMDEPSERTLERWAQVVCDTARRPLTRDVA